ncbi:hypothetical protein OS188_08490 [Xanthomarina sp. F1114]|uniref:hypothetical protein n=1 Tax=Xanthomarina sp. F1114 TaxID=2996019 RepID=UPI00225E058B|nr:hypothetical protein [Xanthomarina sp. F1114]MCX7547990.1 hypothetical protein [Xanthomarina sp. F1114]
MKKLTKQAFSNYLAVCVFSLLFFNVSFAQERILRIYDDGNETRNLRSSIDIPDNLLHGLNPSVYIENARVINNTGGDSPKVIKLLDGNSVSAIEGANPQYNQVELITIILRRPSDLNTRFDLSRLNGFSSLKYIYIKSLFECTEQQINNYLLNAESVTTVFYKVVNPS